MHHLVDGIKRDTECHDSWQSCRCLSSVNKVVAQHLSATEDQGSRYGYAKWSPYVTSAAMSGYQCFRKYRRESCQEKADIFPYCTGNYHVLHGRHWSPLHKQADCMYYLGPFDMESMSGLFQNLPSRGDYKFRLRFLVCIM